MKYLAVLLVCSLIVAPCAVATETQALEFQSGDAAIIVQKNDGKACSGGTVQVFSEKGELVKTIKLDDCGQATLGGIAEGKYKMTFPGYGILPFSVNPKSQTTSLVVMLPPPPEKAGSGSKIELPVLAVHILGVAAVTGLAIFLIIITADAGQSGTMAYA